MRSRSLLATAALALLLAAAAHPGDAQGAQPTTAVPSFALSVAYIDFGLTGDPNDDCAYLEMSDPGDDLEVNDVRILRSFRAGSVCADTLPGSLVATGDNAELFATNVRIIPMTLKYVDGNANSRFDGNDTLYLDPDSSPGLRPTSSTGTQVTPTIRLTPAGDMPAGTLVFSNHADWYGGGQTALPLASPSVTWIEKEGDTLFGPADDAYLLPQNGPGFPAARTMPIDAMHVDGPGFATFVTAAGSGSSSTTTTGTSSTTQSSSTRSTTTFTPPPPSSSATTDPTTDAPSPSYPKGNPRTGQPTASKSSPAGALAAAAGLAAALALARRRLA